MEHQMNKKLIVPVVMQEIDQIALSDFIVNPLEKEIKNFRFYNFVIYIRYKTNNLEIVYLSSLKNEYFYNPKNDIKIKLSDIIKFQIPSLKNRRNY